MDRPFSYSMKLDMSHVDFTGRWQPGSIFRAMQEASTLHSAMLGVGFEDMRAQGLAWVLGRALLRMDEYPRLEDTVTVNTWPGKVRHAFFPRYYTFYLGENQIGCATTLYLVMDLETRKSVLGSALKKPVPEYDLAAPLPFPGNMQTMDILSRETSYSPVYTDYDMNGHANNTRYVDWFTNLFSYERHANKELEEILIHYQHEVLAGDSLVFHLQDDGNTSILHGSRDELSCFALQGKWRQRS